MGKKILLFALTISLVAGLLGGATMAWFTDSDTSQVIDMSAGTLLIGANTSMIYGVEYKEGKEGSLYEILVDEGNNTVNYAKLFDSTKKSLNALAFDRSNKRLYYANGKNLFFYDLTTGDGDTPAGVISDKNIYNATFGLGHYWFVKESTDDLYKVSFKSDGKIDEVVLYHENFTGQPGRQFEFGDIALDMRDGIIYGSTTGKGNTNKEFFSYNVQTGDYSRLSNNANSLQLAFGADGVLYGTVTREYDWYTVDVSTGEREWFYKSDKMFSDLASNHQNNWNPGDRDMVRYYVTNIGTKNSYVRGTISGSWIEGLSSQNITYELSTTDWELQDGCYYYKHILAPGENTKPLILIVHLDGESTHNDYQGEEFEMSVSFEAIQTTHDAVSQWGWNPPNGL